MFIKRLFLRYMDEADASGSAGGTPPAAAPAAAAPIAAPAAAPAAATGLEPVASLLGDAPPDPNAPPVVKPGDPPAADAPPAAIEYTDFTMPEGVTLDPAKATEFKALANSLGLPQEGAQKIVDMYSAELKQVQEAPLKAWNTLQTEWRAGVTNHPEIGGANLDANLGKTKAALVQSMGAEASGKFLTALSLTGAGNNPDVIYGLYKAMQPLFPATPINGSPGGSAKSAGATMYPSMAGLGNGHKE
jgi:hypothetical protein